MTYSAVFAIIARAINWRASRSIVPKPVLLGTFILSVTGTIAIGVDGVTADESDAPVIARLRASK
jgi:hypothetical protein